MKRINFKIPIYDWNVTVCTLYDKSCEDDLKKLSKEFNFPDEDDIVELLQNGRNGGRTYTKTGTRDIVILLFPWTNEEWFIRTINHEKRHVVDDIIEWHNIQDKEASAYLDGYISAEIYKQLNQLK